MKKIVKTLSIIIITLSVLCILSNTFVYAEQPLLPDIKDYEPSKEDTPIEFTNMIGFITTIIQIVGIVISVIVIILIGIKYMVGSVEERAEYKKTMFPFLIGAFLITGTSTLVKIILKLTEQVVQ